MNSSRYSTAASRHRTSDPGDSISPSHGRCAKVVSPRRNTSFVATATGTIHREIAQRVATVATGAVAGADRQAVRTCDVPKVTLRDIVGHFRSFWDIGSAEMNRKTPLQLTHIIQFHGFRGQNEGDGDAQGEMSPGDVPSGCGPLGNRRR